MMQWVELEMQFGDNLDCPAEIAPSKIPLTSWERDREHRRQAQ